MEGKSQIPLLLCAQLIQIMFRIELGNRLLSDILFQPEDKLRHGHTVFDMSLLHIFNFNRILDRLGRSGRIHAVYNGIRLI